MNSSGGKTILLIDDEEITLKTWSAILERNGFNVLAVHTVNEAVDIADRKTVIDLILTDIDLGSGIDGVEIAEEIRKTRDIPVMFLSNHTEPDFVQKADKVSHSGYVIKSNGESVVVASIKMAFRLNDANVSINNQKQEIESVNEEMQAAMEELESINLELVETQKNLIESEGKYRRLYESIRDAVVIVDMNGRIIDSNPAYQEMTGYTGEELKNFNCRDLLPDKWLDEERNVLMDQLLSRGYSDIYEKELIRKDGVVIPVELRSFLAKDDLVNYTAVIGIVRNISERKKAEREISEREQKFRTIFENAPYPITINRVSDSVCIDVNRKYQEYTGLTKSEVIGKCTSQLVTLADPSVPGKMMEEFSLKGKIDSYQFSAILKNGKTTHNLLSAYPVEVNGEKCIAAITTDITELRNTEMALRKSEAEMKSLLDALLVGVGMIVDRRFTRVNSYLCSLLGYDESELTGSFTKIIYFDDAEYKRTVKELFGMMSREGSGITKAVIRHKDGHILDCLITLTPIDPDDVSAGVCATLNDITELSRAENALRESEIRFKSVMEQSTLPMLIVDCSGTMVDANIAWASLWNADRTLSVGKYNVFSDVQNQVIKPLFDKALAGEPSDIPEHLYNPVLTGRTGEMLWLTGRAYPLKDRRGSVTNVVIIMEDITERKQAEEALRLSEEKFRNIFNNMSIGYFRTGLDGHIIDLNPACLAIFGFSSLEDAYSNLGGTTSGVYASESDWVMLRKNLMSGKSPLTGIFQFKRKDEAEFSGSLNIRVAASADGTPLYVEGLVEDVTNRLKTQEMLIQSEKMITVAGLAAGMAHEINNPLGIIMQNAENATHRLLDELPGNIDAAVSAGTGLNNIREYIKLRRVDQYLSSIKEAGERAAKIVGNMLQFSRGTESKITYLNLNNLLDRALDLASNDYDLRKKYDFKNIRITKQYGEIPDIQCAETPIEQVFLNLFKNSAQAMSGTSREPGKIPEIVIKTESSGKHVRIEIGDNGPGMDEPTRRRIFEPFFSTKEPGLGTGLGLSVSYYIIVDGHGGTISVESSPDSGTLFIITLPVKKV